MDKHGDQLVEERVKVGNEKRPAAHEERRCGYLERDSFSLVPPRKTETTRRWPPCRCGVTIKPGSSVGRGQVGRSLERLHVWLRDRIEAVIKVYIRFILFNMRKGVSTHPRIKSESPLAPPTISQLSQPGQREFEKLLFFLDSSLHFEEVGTGSNISLSLRENHGPAGNEIPTGLHASGVILARRENFACFPTVQFGCYDPACIHIAEDSRSGVEVCTGRKKRRMTADEIASGRSLGKSRIARSPPSARMLAWTTCFPRPQLCGAVINSHRPDGSPESINHRAIFYAAIMRPPAPGDPTFCAYIGTSDWTLYPADPCPK
ncbi:hypothetical protein B0H19DRAFT_1062949 [Mycena capillaripes]|nr:hypothetical protein B0H19DRAFT_1062949 [Mycena capillaripes]